MAIRFLEFMNFDFPCTLSRILLDVPHQLWEFQTGSGMGNTLVVRFLHNKLSVLINNLARCYVSFFSPDYLAGVFTLFGMVFFFVGLYFLISLKKFPFLIPLLTMPILVFFEFSVIPYHFICVLIIIYGLIKSSLCVKKYF